MFPQAHSDAGLLLNPCVHFGWRVLGIAMKVTLVPCYNLTGQELGEDDGLEQHEQHTWGW